MRADVDYLRLNRYVSRSVLDRLWEDGLEQTPDGQSVLDAYERGSAEYEAFMDLFLALAHADMAYLRGEEES